MVRIRSMIDRIAGLRMENLFFFMALFGGLVFSVVTPPFQAPDEHVHFMRAYQISEGHPLASTVLLPKSIVDFTHQVSAGLPGNDQNKQSKKALVAELSRKFTDEPRTEMSLTTTLIYSPVPYVPQALAITLGRLLRLPPLFIYLLARTATLLAWASLIYLAIRATPILPRLFFALALMPMTLFLGDSVSPDAITIALGFLFIAMVLRLALDRQHVPTSGDWIGMAVITLLTCLCKSVVLLLIPLLLLIPIRDRRRWQSYLPIFLTAAGLVIGLAWVFGSLRLYQIDTTEMNMPGGAGLSYFISHPASSTRVFFHTIAETGWYQTRMFIGILGWIDTVLPRWVYPLYLGILIVIALFETNPVISLPGAGRALATVLALLTIPAVLMPFFFGQITVGNGIIGGIQGRYFLPVAPLYALPFYNRRLCLDEHSPAWAGVLAVIVLVWAVSVRTMLSRYYAI